MTPHHLDDWIAETPESIAARLEAAREAQRQTRFVLGMLAVISMMMVILAYNAYLSYDSRWVLNHAREDGKIRTIKAGTADSVPDVLALHALQDWAASRTATIDLLGIHVSVDDAPVLGTTSLFLLSLWLLLVTRRENHTVGSLLRDTDTPGADSSSSLVGSRACGLRATTAVFERPAVAHLPLDLRQQSLRHLPPLVAYRFPPRPEGAGVRRADRHQAQTRQVVDVVCARLLLLVSRRWPRLSSSFSTGCPTFWKTHSRRVWPRLATLRPGSLRPLSCSPSAGFRW